MKIAIDPGHGGEDSGATYGGLDESKLVLDIALRARELLEPHVEVMMTRESDVFIPLMDRCKMANEAEVSAYVSLHLNAASSSSVKGWETFSCLGTTLGDILAECLAARHAEAYPTQKARGVKEASLYVLRHTHAPAALHEFCFLSNEEEAIWASHVETRQAFAQSLSLGILDYCGISIDQEAPELTLEQRVERIERELNLV